MLSTIQRLFSRAKPNPIEVFLNEHVIASDGSSVTLNDLYNTYCRWCESAGNEPEVMPTFARRLHETGMRKEKIGGRVRYFDVALRDEQLKATGYK